MPRSEISEIGVYERMMASRVTGSRRRSIRCWPVGRPMTWSGCSRVKVNIRVSEEIVFLADKMALVQDLGCKKMGLGCREFEGVSSELSVKMARDSVSRVPI